MTKKIQLCKINKGISELDGIRGLAVLMVFIYHILGVLGINKMYVGNFNVVPFMMWGHLGVNIFYTLSAFLLFIPFVKAYRANERINLRKYALKRILRVIPAFYFYIIIFVICVNPELISLNGIRDILGNMLFLQNYADIIPFNDTVWTLAIELQFYILIPFIYKIIMKNKNAILLLISSIFVLVYRISIMFYLRPNFASDIREFYIMAEYNILGCIDNFMIGMIIAKLYVDYKNSKCNDENNLFVMKKIIAVSRRIVGISPIIIVLLMINYYNANNYITKADSIFFSFFFDIVLYLVIGGVFVILLFTNSKLRILFNNKILRFMGKISYSLYIWHLFIQVRLANIPIIVNANSIGTKYIIIFILSIAIIIPFSLIMYYLIEKPFIEMAKKI